MKPVGFVLRQFFMHGGGAEHGFLRGRRGL